MTSPRVAPGLLSWQAWEALRSASAVLVPAGHPLLPALDEAGSATGWSRSLTWWPWLTARTRWSGCPRRAPSRQISRSPPARLLAGAPDLPGAHLLDLVTTMDRLRTECPWDIRQTHESLAPYLLEDPEALEALESGDAQALCEELGDVLLQVAFHARIAAERHDGTGYTIDDVADGIVAKLVRRHPHVFADVTVSGAEGRPLATGTRSSGKSKRLKAGRAACPLRVRWLPSALDAVPFGQPALVAGGPVAATPGGAGGGAGRAGGPRRRSRAPITPAGEIGRDLFRCGAEGP